KKCICGSKIKENNYEKFLYDTSEYKEILKYKNKSLETINSALNFYDEEFQKLNIEIQNIQKKINELNKFLKDAIESIEYSGNSQMTDDIDRKITKIKDEIFELKKLEDLYQQKDKYDKSFNTKNLEYTSKQKTFKNLEYQYKETHNSVITNFNIIYNILMKKSSANTKKAIIDDDYMPLIDGGVYREKSASVPIRMMYFFTLLSMSLKYPKIKHPKFLLMDTPEEAGIDENHLETNIKLFDTALNLSKNYENEKIKDYQFILTTGLEKYPEKYEKYVKLDFNKEESRFILKSKK
ncbi:MAG: Chromosome segregation protein, partial [uncultured Sulfurovum sp.]